MSPRPTHQPPTISVLADEVIDQIAAGEVVERPASVVRELLDNAVDAGARRIEVEFSGGGIERLLVRDDGCGIPAEQVPLALQRHATSKIRSADDLLEVRTLGFRGEALPSIASVSRFALTTRPAAALAAVRLELQGGRELKLREVGAPAGTAIEVEELFFNVPARRKFLSAARTEGNHILEVCRRLVLACPEIHLVVREEGREALLAPASADPLPRLAAVFGRETSARLVPVERLGSLVKVTGFLSPPDLARRLADGLFLFVNGRSVRDRQLVALVRSAYQGLLPGGRFPLAVLHLELDPQEVDVNVHPQKAEVRFRKREGIHGSLVLAIRETLARAAWLGLPPPLPDGEVVSSPGNAFRLPSPVAPPGAAERGRPGWVAQALLFEEPSSSGASSAGPPTGAVWAGTGLAGQGSGASVLPGGPGALPPPAVADLPQPPACAATSAEPRSEAATGPAPAAPRPGYFSRLRLLGQACGTWLVCEGPGGLVIIDQHAAHERVTYERLRAAWLRGGMSSQPFLLPLRAELGPRARRTLEANAPLLGALGFEVEHFGGESFLIKSVPAILVGADAVALLDDLLGHLDEESGLAVAAAAVGELPAPLQERIDELLATMACHGSVRAGQELAPAETRALLHALDRVDFSGNCPHGRPVLTELSHADLERRMMRRK